MSGSSEMSLNSIIRLAAAVDRPGQTVLVGVALGGLRDSLHGFERLPKFVHSTHDGFQGNAFFNLLVAILVARIYLAAFAERLPTFCKVSMVSWVYSRSARIMSFLRVASSSSFMPAFFNRV